MLSGTTIGFICVIAVFCASILLAFLDRKEKGKGKMALILFLIAFVGGVVVTLTRAIQPRQDSMGVIRGRAGSPPDSSEGSGLAGPERIGKIDEEEFKRLKEKIASDPKDVASRERLGHLYLQQQDFENVFQMAHEALQLNPRSVESRAHMGMVLFAMQEIDSSLQQFDQALAINPRSLEVLLDKGIVQFQGKDDLKGARETWAKFMKIAKPSDTGYERVKMFLETIEAQLDNRR